LRTIGCIHGISHKEGSALGGLGVTICGKSFRMTSAEIDGTYCEVTRTNFNTITCKTGPHYKINLEDHCKGGAGLYCKGYDHSDNILWENSIPSTSSHYDESTSKSSIHEYFKPPKQENILFIKR